MLEFLIWYFAVGAIFGTFMWFVAGRHVPAHPKIRKETTLLGFMLAWPIALVAYFVLLWRELRKP